MATAKKRKLDSISDGPAPSEPEPKRHHTTNRCRLTELPDELLILIAEHLAGFDDPITYVHRVDGKLIIEHPKAYHDVSLAGLRDLSDTLYIEFEKALHRNGIVTFKDQFAFAEYFDPDMLQNHPRLMNFRLATQNMRFNLWKSEISDKADTAISLLVNLKKIHLGGAWKEKDGPLRLTPAKSNTDQFAAQVLHLLISLTLFLPWPQERALVYTYGPGRFGHNTIYSGKIIDDSWDGDDGSSNTFNHATFDELLPIWNEDQSTLDCISSIISMDEATLSRISWADEAEKDAEKT